MWKKLVLLGGLLACLGLPAFAAADVIGPVPTAKKALPMQLKGKLQKEVAEPNDVGPFLPGERNPEVLWKLLMDGKTYDLDLDNKHDLWVLAEANVGKTVLVNGTWDGEVVHVASLKGDVEHVNKKVTVEVKGRLNAVYPPIPEFPARPAGAKAPRDFPPYDFGPIWQIAVGDKTYALDFAHAGAEGLLDRANELNGRTVIVTGELENDTTIWVAGLKADDEYFKVTETEAEVKGKLQYVITHFMTGQVIMVCDAVPANFSRSWTLNYGFVVDGKTYILDLHGDKKLERDARSFLGLTATASGVLNGDRVKVDSLTCDETILPDALPVRALEQ
jgi:hypothetical protein